MKNLKPEHFVNIPIAPETREGQIEFLLLTARNAIGKASLLGYVIKDYNEIVGILNEELGIE